MVNGVFSDFFLKFQSFYFFFNSFFQISFSFEFAFFTLSTWLFVVKKVIVWHLTAAGLLQENGVNSQQMDDLFDILLKSGGKSLSLEDAAADAARRFVVTVSVSIRLQRSQASRPTRTPPWRRSTPTRLPRRFLHPRSTCRRRPPRSPAAAEGAWRISWRAPRGHRCWAWSPTAA